MKLVINILFLIALGYYFYKFIQLLIKMKQPVIVPINESERNVLRIFPQKPVASPSYAKQKWGIIIYSFMLLFVLTMFIIGFDLNWSYQILLFLPLINSRNSFNLFALVEDGILCGDRFIAWKQMKSFQVVPIEPNHKYYGYEKDVNEGYEIRIKTRGRSISCIVTTSDMNEKLTGIIAEKAPLDGANLI
ncbi:hypothetical protein [Bacillus tuaregi]|uniref:hypothetical protein n=1 Tax=Bacillus tuaregi TaxID=1816695 RepID=UPI0008F82D5C|nr:hypothetical protein [Bacillus tuaregi]